MSSLLPGRNAKPLYNLVLLGEVDLDLLPGVEDGAIAARAENLLVERTLASLALRPQPRVPFFQGRHLVDVLLVEGALLGLAVVAHGLRVDLKRNLKKTMFF